MSYKIIKPDKIFVYVNMGNFDDTKPKSASEDLAYALNELEDMKFHMACFVDSFKKYLIKSKLLGKDGKEMQS